MYYTEIALAAVAVAASAVRFAQSGGWQHDAGCAGHAKPKCDRYVSRKDNCVAFGAWYVQ